MKIEELNEKLLEASSTGDLKEVESLLEQGADVKWMNEYGYTALMYAARLYGHKDICEALINKGADVNATTEDGDTALMEAAGYGHKDVCELLIANGADVNATNKNGVTALYQAARLGYNNDVCELLIANGAKVDEKTLAKAHLSVFELLSRAMQAQYKSIIKNDSEVLKMSEKNKAIDNRENE